MTDAERRARVRANIGELETILVPAVDLVEAVRADVRAIEGDHDGLIFWPLARPTADRQASDYTEWQKRVDEIFGRF